MQRVTAVLVMVVGLVVAVGGLVGFIGQHTHSPLEPVEITPTNVTRHLTKGVWIIYGQADTGPYRSSVVFDTTITGADGRQAPLTAPTYVNNIHDAGLYYTESASVLIPATGAYRIQNVLPPGAPLHPLRTLLAPPPPQPFPLGTVSVDGFVLLAVGAAWVAIDHRRRRQVDVLETMYTSGGPPRSDTRGVALPVS